MGLVQLMFHSVTAITAFFFVWQLQAAVPGSCVASVPLGSFRLLVQAPGGAPRPVQRMNIIRAGEKLLYEPLELAAELKKKARVALVLVPDEKDAKLTVFEPQPAGRPAVWIAPFRVAIVSLVIGPQGLDHKKISSMVNKDRELVAQLADYADHTAQVETLIQTLASAEQGPSSSRNLDAALMGFASQYSASIPKLDRTAPTDQQAAVLLRALNPALGSYDPLAPDPSLRMQQSAGLAASVAALFLGTNVGLAAGGAAMFQNLRTLLFPGTDFRTALVQPASRDGMTLCARRENAKSRTRLAYLWATRLPNVGPPMLRLPATAHLPLGIRSSLPVQVANAADRKLISRTHDWALVSGDGRSFPVPVKPAAEGHALEVDLTGVAAAPGKYRLTAHWDWDAFTASGTLHLHAIPDLKAAALTPESQDRLVESSGPVEVQLTGPDFEFVDRMMLEKKPLEFTLAAGPRSGVQPSLRAVIDTTQWKAGRYLLAMHQADGSAREMPVRVLPPNPRIENLPLRANLGEDRQTLVLHGTGLDRIVKIDAPGAQIELGPVACGAREASIRLDDSARMGERLGVSLQVEGRNGALEIPRAIEIAGPRPRIESVTTSLPDDLGVALRRGELPAGSFVSFAVRVEHAERSPVVRLACQENERTLAPEVLRAGEKHAAAKLDTAGVDLFFLSLDPGAIGRAGCTLLGEMETPAGTSDRHVLGRVIRLPRIDSFSLTDEKLGGSAFIGVLTGQDLESIEQAGWDPDAGLPVAELPKPVAGEGQKQTLRIALPWPSPSPHAPVYVWLRGEPQGRLTRAKD